ncbi:MAG: PorT family protein [Sphingobacteriales bacterium]|nr:PorT family protein [Sphingobacteriales bacterium]MBI3719894.1 PorT family protein [Sphingobacteriales bacterium]
MPANDFEKQAKQLLDEVSIRPNEQVWIEVEKRIREKKRRRWLIILPLMAGLMLGGYFITQQYGSRKEKIASGIITNNAVNTPEANNNDSDKKQKETSAVDDKKEKEEINPVVDSKSIEKIKPTNGDQQKKEQIQKSITANEEIKKLQTVNNKAGIKEIVIRKNDPRKSAINPANDISQTVDQGKNGTKKKPVDANTEITTQLPAENQVNDNTIKENKDAEPALTGNETVKPLAKVDSVITENQPVANTIAKVDPTPVIVQTSTDKKAKPGKNKWKLGVMFNAGVSNVSNQFFSLDLNKNNEDKSLPNLSTGGPSTATYYYPSSNYKAFALQAGVFVQKEISKRSIISVGLNYSLYQTKIKTGNFVYASSVQASNTNFYANVRPGNGATGSIDYHSKLQYLELPVNYSVRLTRNNKIPLYWNGGISAGLLLGSNYLHYDTASQGIYFKDNSLLRKVSFNLQTGFSFTLASKSRTPFTIGPSVQFGLTDILKKGSDKRYVLFGGLKMQMLLPGKKNK